MHHLSSDPAIRNKLAVAGAIHIIVHMDPVAIAATLARARAAG
jgi:hypothetical protein